MGGFWNAQSEKNMGQGNLASFSYIGGSLNLFPVGVDGIAYFKGLSFLMSHCFPFYYAAAI